VRSPRQRERMQPCPAAPPQARGPPAPPEASKPSKPPEAKKAAAAEPERSAGAAPSSSGDTANGGVAAEAVEAPPEGTVVRIMGLKAQPALNGEHGLVLRPGSTPERTVVKTRFGEKSLKHGNLQCGLRVVLPHLACHIIAVVFALTVAAAADALLNGPRGFGVVATPALAVAWLLLTIGICGVLYRPCRPSSEWLPPFHALGSARPARKVYRGGFVIMALLLGASTWLYGELVFPRLGPVPPPEASLPQAAPAEEAASEEEGHEVETTEAAPTDDAAASGEDSPKIETVEENASATNATASNATRGNVTRILDLSERTERSCIFYGHVAALCALLQGVFLFEARLSLQSLLHIAAGVGFVTCTLKHCNASTILLMSTRGAPLVAASEVMAQAVKMRNYLTSYVPLVLMGAPLCSQMMTATEVSRNYQQPQTWKSVLASSGLLTTVYCVQWGALVAYVIFVGSYACDFWAVTKLP